MDGPRPRSISTSVASLSGVSLLLVMPYCSGSTAGPSSAPPPVGIVGMHVVGQPVLVWDHRVDQRGPLNIPDLSPTVYKEADGTVDLMIAHFENYRMRGPDLEHLVSFPNIVFSSTTQASEIGEFHDDYHHWLAAPYTFDGQNIYALAHSEWYACLLNGDCAKTTPATSTSSGSYQLNSWANTVTSLVSGDGGASWAVNGSDAAHVVANESFTWTGSVALASAVYRTALDHTGLFEPSRLVREGDFFYSVALLIHRDFNRLDSTTGQAPVDKYGLILMRTSNLSKASGWEGWVTGGQFVPLASHGFSVFQPLSNGAPLNAHTPQLIFDQNAKAFIALFSLFSANNQPGPLYYMTTPSLANPGWSAATVVSGTATLQINPRGDPAAACSMGFSASNYVSVIDTHSDGLNFEFTDGDPYLFYVYNPALVCGGNNNDRDLFRVQLAIDHVGG